MRNNTGGYKPSTRVLIDPSEEIGALGAALLDAKQATELISALKPSDFGHPSNRQIFKAMTALGAPFDARSIAGELHRQGVQIDFDYIDRLDWGVVTQCSMARRIARLKEWRRLRELVQIGEELNLVPYDVGANALEIIGRLRARLEELSQ